MTATAIFITIVGLIIGAANIGKTKNDYVVLLQDNDKKVGSISIKGKDNDSEIILDKEKYVVAVDKKGNISEPKKIDEDEFNRKYKDLVQSEPKKPVSFTLYFQFGSDNLTEESLLIIPKILDEIKSRQLPEVQIIGHTDTVGKQEDNYYLGLKRAEVMEKIVLEAGVPKEIVEINSLGEEDPFVESGDEKDEPLNRRVEITIK